MPAKLFSREERRAAADKAARSPEASDEPVVWNFADLEYHLSVLHAISPRQRTAFQARLKNFHKLGFPSGFKGSKGKAAKYGPGEIVSFALAVELTQFGMAPERVVRMLVDDWFATTTAIRMAAQGILSSPETFDPSVGPPPHERLSMFLHFDPNALSNMQKDSPSLTQEDASIMSFFYGGQGVVRDNLVNWTDNIHSCRLSLINVTALLYNIMGGRWTDLDIARLAVVRERFFSQLIEWAHGFEPEHANPETAEVYVLLYLRHCLADEVKKRTRGWLVDELTGRTGMSDEIVRRAIKKYFKEDGRLNHVDPQA